jgi:hypothetical protein
MSKLRFCNEPGCSQQATPGFSKCEPHGLIARQNNLDDKARWARIEQEDKARWARIEQEQDDADVQALAASFNVDPPAIEALVEYIRRRDR